MYHCTSFHNQGTSMQMVHAKLDIKDTRKACRKIDRLKDRKGLFGSKGLAAGLGLEPRTY